MNRSIVIIPTYNEAENIVRLIPDLFSRYENLHALIVDDGSPDGTSDKVVELQQKFLNRLYLIQRNGKQGLGTAYLEGFRFALQNNYEFIFEMDADFSHPPDSLAQLYNACLHGADVAVGSRYTKGGRIQNWPFGRILMSYFASLYVRAITWLPVSDTTAGFICYRRNVLETIDLNKIKSAGYAFQIEMKFAAWKLGFRIQEVPITFSDRTEGSSKMSSGIFNEAMAGVLKMRFSGSASYYRKK